MNIRKVDDKMEVITSAKAPQPAESLVETRKKNRLSPVIDNESASEATHMSLSKK